MQLHDATKKEKSWNKNLEESPTLFLANSPKRLSIYYNDEDAFPRTRTTGSHRPGSRPRRWSKKIGSEYSWGQQKTRTLRQSEHKLMDGGLGIAGYRGYRLLIKLFGISRGRATTRPSRGEQHEQPRWKKIDARPEPGPKLLINVICYRGSSGDSL